MSLPNDDPNRKYSYADYLTWPEDERWEIIDGFSIRDVCDESGTKQ